jgi:hypothetical protein
VRTRGRVLEDVLTCRARADRVDYPSFFGKPKSSRPPTIGSSSFRNMQRCSPLSWHGRHWNDLTAFRIVAKSRHA